MPSQNEPYPDSLIVPPGKSRTRHVRSGLLQNNARPHLFPLKAKRENFLSFQNMAVQHDHDLAWCAMTQARQSRKV